MPKQQSIEQEPASSQRLDKWLWYARVVKTRTLAASLVQRGKVRVNREKTDKPGHAVKIDDVITVAVHGRVKVLQVKAPGARRGPAPEAADLFEDISPPPDPVAAQGSPGARTMPGPSGLHGDRVGERPTKRDRRVIDRLQNKFSE